jgi:1-phosphofructokinase family hexose kinase
MILIITLNPLLERRFIYEKVSLNGEVNRNGNLFLQAGGKGINVSRQLKKLGVESHNLFFSGGLSGKLLRDLLRKENLSFTSIPIEDETRQAAIILSKNDNKIFSFFSSNPNVTDKEIEQMKNSISKMISNCEMIIISGSAPTVEAGKLVSFTISESNQLDKVSICDYYGDNLNEVFDSAPTMVHNNLEEIKNYLKVKLEGQHDILNLLKSLYKKGIKRVYLTNEDKDIYAQNFDYIYKITPPKVDSVDSTGCGDAFVSGLIYGWKNGDVFEHSLKYSTALASINSTTFDVCNVEPNSFEYLIDNVIVETVGKKIKLIDDSPTSH